MRQIETILSLTCCNSRCSASHDQHSRTPTGFLRGDRCIQEFQDKHMVLHQASEVKPCRIMVVSTDRSGYIFRYDGLTLKMKALLIVRQVCNHLPLDKSNSPGDRAIKLAALPIETSVTIYHSTG